MAYGEPRLADGARKVLILRMDRIGDMLLSTPAIRNLREGLPSAHLTLIASPYNAPVLRGWEAVDEVRVYDLKWPASRKRGFARRLREEGYDLCVVLSTLMESYRLAFGSRARIRAGILYSRRLLARVVGPIFLTHPIVIDIDGAVERGEYVPHEVEQMLSLVKLLGLPAKEHPLEVPVSRADREWARDLVSRSCSGQTLIGLHLSSKWFSSGWTGLGMTLLLEEILKAIPDSAIIVTYGLGEADAAEQLAPHLDVDRGSDLARSLTGRVMLAGDLSFGQWAGLLSLCGVILTRDTGSLHLAAALGVPLVAIYEKGSFQHNAQQWAPWKVPHFSIEAGEVGETSFEILRRVSSLLGESARRAA